MKANDVVDMLVEQETGVLIPEFTVGPVRIDLMAVDDDSIRGYEVKASTDRVNDRRFHQQLRVYTQSMEYLTYVVATKFIDHCKEELPEWVGIVEIVDGQLVEIRKPERNPSMNSRLLSRMLWKDEATKGVKELGLYYKNKFECPWCSWARNSQHDPVSKKCTRALSYMIENAMDEETFLLFIRRALANRSWGAMAGRERRRIVKEKRPPE